MGNNVNFVKWKWNHFVTGSRRLGCCVYPGAIYLWKFTIIAPAGSRRLVRIANV